MLDAVKSERIIVCLFTEANGRQYVGAANFDAERSTPAILSEAIEAVEKNDGQMLDLDFPFN